MGADLGHMIPMIFGLTMSKKDFMTLSAATKDI
jgi:hypothetical protein